MKRLSAYKHQRRTIAIGRHYATQWREADRAELPRFLELVNEDCARVGDPTYSTPYEFDGNPKRREVLIYMPGRDYRAVLLPGVDPWTWPSKPIAAADVERFERRAAP